MSQEILYICNICKRKSNEEMCHGPLRLSLQFGVNSQKWLTHGLIFSHYCDSCKDKLINSWQLMFNSFTKNK